MAVSGQGHGYSVLLRNNRSHGRCGIGPRKRFGLVLTAPRFPCPQSKCLFYETWGKEPRYSSPATTYSSYRVFCKTALGYSSIAFVRARRSRSVNAIKVWKSRQLTGQLWPFMRLVLHFTKGAAAFWRLWSTFLLHKRTEESTLPITCKRSLFRIAQKAWRFVPLLAGKGRRASGYRRSSKNS